MVDSMVFIGFLWFLMEIVFGWWCFFGLMGLIDGFDTANCLIDGFSCWWFQPYPTEKYQSIWMMTFPTEWKNKGHVPNHHFHRFHERTILVWEDGPVLNRAKQSMKQRYDRNVHPSPILFCFGLVLFCFMDFWGFWRLFWRCCSKDFHGFADLLDVNRL